MTGRRATLLAATLLATLAAAGARAEDPKQDGFADRLFAGKLGDPKTNACFVRHYDADHLARHPLQQVSAMKLLVTAEKVPEDQALNYSFRLGVKFRDRPGDFDSSGDCGHPKAAEIARGEAPLGCAVDCDGGGIDVELSPDDGAAIVKLDSIRTWRNDQPDEEAGMSLTGGADDRLFQLARANLNECASLVTDRKELAALRRK
jgi:hypothetical protein